jgi:periplasmic protein TonB
MRFPSAAMSFTIHVGLVLAAVWATARPPAPAIRPRIVISLPPAPGPSVPRRPGTPLVPTVPDPVVHLPLDLPTITPDDVGVPGPVSAPRPVPGGPGGTPGAWFPAEGQPIDAAFVDDPPVLLAGPMPAYPDLLRQAGLEGRVLLEAVVDTTGRVEPGSIAVVAATNPAFVEAARRALAGSLFRPGRVGGQAVRVRIRLPTAFVLDRHR